MYLKWETVLVDWVNCLGLCEITELSDLRNGEFIRQFRQIFAHPNDRPILDDDLTGVFKLMYQHYPNIQFTEQESIHINDLPHLDLIMLASLLMHYSCIFDRKPHLTTLMCENLTPSTQKNIKKFLERVSTNTSTEELQAIIKKMAAKSKEGLFQDLEVIVSTPVEKSSPLGEYLKTPQIKCSHGKGRDIRQLEEEMILNNAEAEAKVRALSNENSKLGGLLKQKEFIIKQLSEEIESFKSTDPPKDQICNFKDTERLLLMKIKDLELYGEKCDQKQDELIKERTLFERKLQQLELDYKSLQQEYLNIAEQFNKSKMDAEALSEKNSILEAHNNELENMLKELKRKSGTASLDDSAQWETLRQRRSLNCEPQDLGHELQLKETQQQLHDITDELRNVLEEKLKLDEDFQGSTNLNNIKRSFLQYFIVVLQQLQEQTENELNEERKINNKFQLECVKISEQFEITLIELNDAKTENIKLSKTKSCLENELAHLKIEMSALETSVQELRLQKENLEGERCQLFENLKKIEFNLNSTNQALEKTQLNNEKYVIEIQELQKDIKETKCYLRNVESQMEQTTKDKVSLNIKLTEAQDKIEEYSVKLRENEKALLELKITLEQKDRVYLKEMNLAKEALQKLKGSNESLQIARMEQDSLISQLHNKLQELEGVLNEKTSELTSVLEEFDRTSNEKSNLTKELKNKCHDLETTILELKEAKDSNETLFKEIQDLKIYLEKEQSYREEIDAFNKTLQSEKVTLEKSLAKALNTAQEYQCKIDENEQTLLEMKTNLMDLKSEKEHLSTVMNVQTNELEKLTEEKKMIFEDLKETRLTLEESNAQIVKQNKINQELESLLNEKASQLKSILEEFDSTSKEKSNLTKELKNKCHDLETTILELKEAKDSNETLFKEIEVLKIYLEKEQSYREEIDAFNKTLQSEKVTLEESLAKALSTAQEYQCKIKENEQILLEMKTNLMDLKSEKEHLSTVINVQTNELKRLTEEKNVILEDLKETCVTLEESNIQTGTQNTVIQDLNKLLNEKTSELASILEEVEHDIHRKEIEAINKDFQELQCLKTQLEKTNKDQENIIKQFQLEISDLKQKFEDLNTEFHAVLAQTRIKDEQLLQYRETCLAMSNELEQFKKEKCNLTNELKDKYRELDANILKIKKSELSNETLTKKLENLKVHLEEERSYTNEINAFNKLIRREKITLEESLTKALNAAQEYQCKIKENERSLLEMKKCLEEKERLHFEEILIANEGIKELQESNKKLLATQTNLQKEIECDKARALETATEYSKKISEKDQLTGTYAELQQLQQIKHELETALDDTVKSLKELESVRKQLETEQKQLEDQLKENQIEKTNLTKEIKDLVRQLTTLEEDKKIIVKSFEETVEKLTICEATLKEKDKELIKAKEANTVVSNFLDLNSEELRKITQEKDQLLEALEMSNKDKLDLEQENRMVNEAKFSSERATERLLLDKETLIGNLQKVLKEKEELVTVTDLITTELDFIKKENQAIARDYQELQIAYQQMETENNLLKESLHDVNYDYEKLRVHIEEEQKHEKELEKLILEKQELLKEKNDIYDFWQQCLEDKEKVVLERNKFQLDFEDSQKEKDALIAKLAQATEENRKLLLALDLSQKETFKIKKERNEILQGQTEILKETESNILRVHEAALEEKQTLLKKIQESEDERNKLRQVYSTVMATNSKLEMENDHFRKLVAERNEEILRYNNIKEAYEKLFEENSKYLSDLEVLKQKRARDREEYLTLLKKEQSKCDNIRTEYENKLEKMKEKMVNLYRAEVQKEIQKVREEHKNETAQLKKMAEDLRKALDESNKKNNVLQVENDAWQFQRSREPFLSFRQPGTKGRGNKVADRNSIMSSTGALCTKNADQDHLPKIKSTSSLPNEMKTFTLPPKFQSGDYVEETITVSRRTSINCLGRNLQMEDEEDDLFNNKYLSDLKDGRCLPNTGRESTSSRMSELAWRNSRVPPHLKSSYPAELQMVDPGKFKEEDIKSGNIVEMDDSLCQLLPGEKPRPKKDFGTTTYRKPGPPTPSKNAGRLSLQGSEIHTLKEVNSASGTPKKVTPGKLRLLFKGLTTDKKDGGVGKENLENATPKGTKRLSIFRNRR
ncbi:hypothetical protein ABEB36_014285 [Hypothenemus hampei]|uniref:Uncharacterized protein n=1 Tax=Hypothenemus hampei TaxID=57062 RepID=A0ABD1E4T8_HYPHA